MRRKLIIIGAGNVGGFLSYNIDLFGAFEVLGFLDDDPKKQGTLVYGQNVLGSVKDLEKYIDGQVSVVIGISSPLAKRNIVAAISKFPVDFPTFISPDVWMSNDVAVGRGGIFYPGTKINYGTKVGDFVIMNMNCAVGHNCSIGSYSSLAPGVNLAGFTVVEEMVSIGIGACTRQGVSLGKCSIIGGQSMVVGDVQSHSKIAGIPARLLTKENKRL